MLAGILAGYAFRRGRALRHINKLIFAATALLLFLMGASIGADKAILNAMASIGAKAAIIAVFAMTGSLLAAWCLSRFIFRKRP